LKRLAGGASREIWSFDAVQGGGRREALILRRDPPGVALPEGAIPRATEAAAIEAAATTGAKVPRVRWRLGESGFIMDRLDGTAEARLLLRDPAFAPARAAYAKEVGAALAAIHRHDGAGIGLKTMGAAEQLAFYRDRMDDFDRPSAIFEAAFRRLALALPKEVPPRLVHGDFRTGNLLFRPEGLVAVLDWELAHRGDPLEDLGWLCVRSWRFGGAGPAGGVATREELWAAYEAAGGGKVDPRRAMWWEMFSTLRWGIICLIQADRHLSGREPSLELLAVGRRASETEYDLAELLA